MQDLQDISIDLISLFTAIEHRFTDKSNTELILKSWRGSGKPMGEILGGLGGVSSHFLKSLRELVESSVAENGGDLLKTVADIMKRHDRSFSSVMGFDQADGHDAESGNSSVALEVNSAPSVYENSARFRFVSDHRRGGLGEVSVAEDFQLHRKVALKKLHPWLM